MSQEEEERGEIVYEITRNEQTEEFTTPLTTEGAQYTTDSYAIERILDAAKINDQYMFKVEWTPTWIERNAFDNDEMPRQYLEEHAGNIPIARRKTKRGHRAGRNHARRNLNEN